MNDKNHSAIKCLDQVLSNRVGMRIHDRSRLWGSMTSGSDTYGEHQWLTKCPASHALVLCMDSTGRNTGGATYAARAYRSDGHGALTTEEVSYKPGTINGVINNGSGWRRREDYASKLADLLQLEAGKAEPQTCMDYLRFEMRDANSPHRQWAWYHVPEALLYALGHMETPWGSGLSEFDNLLLRSVFPIDDDSGWVSEADRTPEARLFLDDYFLRLRRDFRDSVHDIDECLRSYAHDLLLICKRLKALRLGGSAHRIHIDKTSARGDVPDGGVPWPATFDQSKGLDAGDSEALVSLDLVAALYYGAIMGPNIMGERVAVLLGYKQDHGLRVPVKDAGEPVGLVLREVHYGGMSWGRARFYDVMPVGLDNVTNVVKSGEILLLGRDPKNRGRDSDGRSEPGGLRYRLVMPCESERALFLSRLHLQVFEIGNAWVLVDLGDDLTGSRNGTLLIRGMRRFHIRGKAISRSDACFPMSIVDEADLAGAEAADPSYPHQDVVVRRLTPRFPLHGSREVVDVGIVLRDGDVICPAPAKLSDASGGWRWDIAKNAYCLRLSLLGG